MRGHVVLDMALSQFSVGALAAYRSRGEPLPVAGGFDHDGALTCDAAAIEASGRLLPVGCWKGSGLAVALDLVAAIASGGCATWQVPPTPETESGLSQMFIALDLSPLDPDGTAARVADDIVAHLRPAFSNGRVRYPGERTLETRRRNLADGIPVEPAIWREVQEMAA